MVTRLQIARPDIVSHFEAMPRVLTEADISEALEEQRVFWRLARSTGLEAFIKFLEQGTPLRRVELPFKRPTHGFTWGEVPVMEMLAGVLPRAYFSHYTALRIHGLTEQVPKTIYLSQEKSAGTAYSTASTADVPYEQHAIDSAFRKAPRATADEIVYGEVRLALLSSAYHAGLGITSGRVNFAEDSKVQYRYTNLERTLIDITVRPFYAGGVFEVAKAFENAREKVSVNGMGAMLKKLKFGYPYHQAIGYYLERARYKPSVVDIFRKTPRERDFYLVHMSEPDFDYVPEWRLHVPKGF